MSERLLAQATLHNVFNCPWAEDRVTEDNFYSFCFWLLSLSITDRGMIQSMTSYWSSSSWVFPELRIQKLGFGWFKSLGNHHSYSRCQKYENVLCLVTLCSPLPLLSLFLSVPAVFKTCAHLSSWQSTIFVESVAKISFQIHWFLPFDPSVCATLTATLPLVIQQLSIPCDF